MGRYARRGVHGQVVEILGLRIVSGEFGEGATIDMAALGTELDVSLTALREALKVLTAKGLVDARQKRGTFVRPRSDWNLIDGDVIRWQFAGRLDERFLENLAEVRGIIEPAVARLAAARRDEADLALLSAALDAMGSAGADPAGAVEADLAFHRSLLDAAHNELLTHMDVVLQAGLAQRDRIVHETDKGDDPVPSHRAVFEAISAADTAAAEQAMRDLLDKSTRDLAELGDAFGEQQ